MNARGTRKNGLDTVAAVTYMAAVSTIDEDGELRIPDSLKDRVKAKKEEMLRAGRKKRKREKKERKREKKEKKKKKEEEEGAQASAEVQAA